MRELENRAQEPSYGNISLIKVAQNDLICYTGCQETPSGTSNHHHQSRPPLLDSQNGPLTQVTKAKVVSNHYSDSVVMSGHHQDTASSIFINQDPSFLSEFGAIVILQTCTGNERNF